MNALHEAKTRIENAYYDERGMAEVMRQDAAVYATIAVAEALQRIADANERQAAAVERRNELLEEVNEASRRSSATLQSSVMDLLNTVFGAAKDAEEPTP